MLRNLIYLLFVCGLAAGCTDKKLDSRYGRSRGDAASSVNGTLALSRMFSAAGFKVRSTRWLSPRIAMSDTLVWFPDDFDAPSSKTRNFLTNEWFFKGTNRTLVYVGRDYDASIAYWRQLGQTAPPDQVEAVDRALASRQVLFDQERNRRGEPGEGWFQFDHDRPRRQITTLSGPWSEGVDSEFVQMELGARLVVDELPENDDTVALPMSAYSEPLLMSGDDVLVARVTEGFGEGNQIIIVANGSFLLNLGLVNHEHRKLAGKLIDQCRAPGRLVFLESGEGGPNISQDDKFIHPFVKAFTVWPLNCIFLHLTVLGAIYCLRVFPIFGRPRSLEGETVSDFGKHIDALGLLLEATGDTSYANARLSDYQQLFHHDQGGVREAPVTTRLAAAESPPGEVVVSSPFAESQEPSEGVGAGQVDGDPG